MRHIDEVFSFFNEKYFNLKCSNTTLYYSNSIEPLGEFKSRGYDGFIYLKPDLKNYQKAYELVLLHEMIHSLLWNKYFIKLGITDDRTWSHTGEFNEIENIHAINYFKEPAPNLHTKYVIPLLNDLKNKNYKFFY